MMAATEVAPASIIASNQGAKFALSRDNMKKALPLLLCGLLMAPVVARAQTYDKAHQLNASGLKSADWPSYRKSDQFQFKSNVMALQYLLRNRGVYKGKIDGVFGAETESSVRNFQRAKGLISDGVVGPKTWSLLLLNLKKGDKGDAVRALQIALRGAFDGEGQNRFIAQEVDGTFGASTLKNLRSYQKSYGDLKADGIAGGRTWSALLRASNAYGD